MGLKRKITTAGNSAALVLSQDLLALMGVGVGDEVDVALVDRTLVVRPIAQLAREKQVSAAIDEVFTRRKSLLKRLAGGPGEDTRSRAKRKS